MNLNKPLFMQLMHTNGHTSQAAIARALGVDPATISRTLRGETTVGTRFIAAFRRAFPNEPSDNYFTT